MLHPDELIPESLMTAPQKQAVIAHITRLPMRGQWKVELLKGWAYCVGYEPSESDLDTVFCSGIDIPSEVHRCH